ncbi:hypothetical protein ABZT02_07705 [Streptomyces sp. NPDC005402]|uniref:hypothetical protein n=1 Tax=Streptomyces sp. NPDC005402 TaxID=3155338 RepID=UPI0033BF8C87
MQSTTPRGGTPLTSSPAAEPSDLAVAIRVGRRMLAHYGDASGFDVFAYAQAHGGLAEGLRILLRALDAEDGEQPGPRTAGNLALRCPAAHSEDPDPCNGPVVVTVLDAQNAGVDGCEHHGARLLASLDGGRVYALPDAPDGAAIRVFKAADATRPFPWLTDAPRTRGGQLSRAEVRERGERA